MKNLQLDSMCLNYKYCRVCDSEKYTPLMYDVMSGVMYVDIYKCDDCRAIHTPEYSKK